jgi:hypothetical protein
VSLSDPKALQPLQQAERTLKRTWRPIMRKLDKCSRLFTGVSLPPSAPSLSLLLFLHLSLRLKRTRVGTHPLTITYTGRLAGAKAAEDATNADADLSVGEILRKEILLACPNAPHRYHALVSMQSQYSSLACVPHNPSTQHSAFYRPSSNRHRYSRTYHALVSI